MVDYITICTTSRNHKTENCNKVSESLEFRVLELSQYSHVLNITVKHQSSAPHTVQSVELLL